MKEVRFEVIEALRFATVHTGGTETFSRELVYAIPLPSTVLGALGVIKGVRLDEEVCQEDLLDLKALAEKLKEGPLDLFATTCYDPLLWGPVIEAGGRYFFCVRNELIDLGGLRSYVDAVLERVKTEGVKPYKRLRRLTRLGIKLTPQKVVDLGYMYRADFYGYDLQPYPASLIYLTSATIEVTSGMVRLGGEGRLTKFLIKEPSEELAEISSKEGEYAVTLAPLLFYSEGEVRPGVTRGLEGVEEVCGLLVNGSKKLRAENVGLGFSEVCKRRRPLLQALPPGTVLKLKDQKAMAMGLFSCLGYGSLLKVGT